MKRNDHLGVMCQPDNKGQMLAEIGWGRTPKPTTQSADPTASSSAKRHHDIPSVPAVMPLSRRRMLKNRANNTVTEPWLTYARSIVLKRSLVRPTFAPELLALARADE